MDSLTLYIASRFSRVTPGAKKRSGLTIGIIGVALSLMVMVLSIGVMTGFKDEIRKKVIGFESAITIAAPDGTDGKALADNLLDSLTVRELAPLLPEGASVEMTIRQPVLLKSAEAFTGALVKGIGSNSADSFLAGSLVEGEMPDFSADSTRYHVALSRVLAETLGVGVGDRLDAFFIGDDVYKLRKLKISGIFDTRFSDFDRNFVLGSAAMLRTVDNLPEGTSTLLEINGFSSDSSIDETAGQLGETFTRRFYEGKATTIPGIINIHDSGAQYFNWLSLLDTNVAVILTLMGLLAALTLVSSLFIIVLRRVSEIGILKALGATDSLIRKVFISLTMRVLLIGMSAGDILGIGILLIQRHFALIPLDPEAYYLDSVPVVINFPSILLLNLAVALCAFLVLLIPSSIISTISPTRTINFG